MIANGGAGTVSRSMSRAVLSFAASSRLTIAGLIFLLGASFVIVVADGSEVQSVPSYALAAPLGLLALNLLAAIVWNPNFRRQLPLLLFHLALLAIVVLAAIGRLTYLRATAEVVVGGEFPSLERIDAGPLHRGRRDQIAFENLGFKIEYKPGPSRDRTINRVRWRDESGLPRETEIGDHIPLLLHGYRFYTTPNKGFAALFRWEPRGGLPETGSVNFPSYPMYASQQTTKWRVGVDETKLALRIDEKLLDPEVNSEFLIPRHHAVIMDFGWKVATLAPGESLLIPAGRLTYLGLTAWMGYSVFYDWTIPWLLVSCALAVLAMSWHFWRKFLLRPWQPG